MPKRTAKEAFGNGSAVSAFAAARNRQNAAKNAAIAQDIASSSDAAVQDDEDATRQFLEYDALRQGRAEPAAAAAASSIDITTASIAHPADDEHRQPLSRFRSRPTPSKENHDVLQVSLETDEYLSCVGIYALEVVTGLITVYGATLPAGETVCIFAPATHALPCIVARSPGTLIKLGPVNHKSSKERHAASLIALSSMSTIWNKAWDVGPSSTFQIVDGTYHDERLLSRLEVDHDVQQTLNRLSNAKYRGPSPPTTLVLGSKGAGKSTFCRHLLNSILTAPGRHPDTTCFWLDLDPGQPEFGPPGQMSLVQIKRPVLGPSYSHAHTHPSLGHRTVASHFLGAKTPAENPSHYLACAADLLRRHASLRKRFPKTRLIINSSGWSVGSGAVLLGSFIRENKVDEIVLLESAGVTSNDLTSAITDAESKANVTSLYSQPRALITRPTAAFRAMQSMSYFHSRLASKTGSISCEKPLQHVETLTLSYNDGGPNSVIYGIATYHDHVDPDHLATVLDGMPVALVVAEMSAVSSKAAISDHSVPGYRIHRTTDHLPLLVSDPGQTSTNVPPLDPLRSICLGQALIQHLDLASKEIHLSTPVTLAEIHQALHDGPNDDKPLDKPVLLLIRGRLDSPDWYLTSPLYHRDSRQRQHPGKFGADGPLAADFDLAPSESSSDEDMVNMDLDGDIGAGDSSKSAALFAAAGLPGPDAERARALLGGASVPRRHRQGGSRADSAAHTAPYVQTTRQNASAVVGRDEERSKSVAAALLSGKVWRPRHLPRNR